MRRKLAGIALSLLAAAGLALLPAACGDHAADPGGNGAGHPVIHEPWPDEEAELLALAMSGEVIASRAHYDQVLDDLIAIRAGWGEIFPRLEFIRYRPARAPGRLDLGVSAAVFDAIRAGEYTAWKDLNQFYQLDYASPRNLETEFNVALYFVPRLNTQFLVEQYLALPGIESARPVQRDIVISNISAYRDGAARWYLFWDQKESCRPDCEGSQAWEFYASPEGVRYSSGWGPGTQTVLRLNRTPGLGFCPDSDALFSVVVEADTGGAQILRGSWLRTGDPSQDVCIEHVMECRVAVELIPRTLTATEVCTLAAALAAIPIEHHAIDGACDPCLITRYGFEGRVEYANPCATSSTEFDERIAALEMFLHELAFGE